MLFFFYEEVRRVTVEDTLIQKLHFRMVDDAHMPSIL